MLKNDLRRAYLDKRAQLSDEECERISSEVAERLFSEIDFNKVRAVHIFLPIERFNEIDTWPIIYRLWTQFPHVQTFAPRMSEDGGDMSSIEITKTTQIVSGRWDVPEPSAGPEIDASEIDVVIVPLLCADEDGFRVGYGKGFYDRFLSKCRPDCRKIGLSHFPPVEKIDDVGEWDVRLDKVMGGGRE